MKKLIILSLFLVAKIAYPQSVSGGNFSSGGNSVFNAVGGAPPFTGGQVAIPVTALIHPQAHMNISAAANKVYLSYDGPTTDPNAGLWVANLSACEASPSTCSWTAVNHAGQLQVNGIIQTIRYMAPSPPDSTHELLIVSFAGNAGQCISTFNLVCAVQVLDTGTNTYTTATLPSLTTGNGLGCLTRDTTGIYHGFTHYGGQFYKSPDTTGGGTWILIASPWSNLPGLTSPASGGNIYVCKVFGNRIYFGGEGGVMSCDFNYTSCSQDYLPFTGTTAPARNLSDIVADTEESTSTTPTQFIECCRTNVNVTNHTPFAVYSSGSWAQLITSNGIQPFGQMGVWSVNTAVIGTGSARRYYFSNSGSGSLYYSFVSTSSAGNNYIPYAPTTWPATSVALNYNQLQITSNPLTGVKWTLFESFNSSGTTPMSLYITP